MAILKTGNGSGNYRNEDAKQFITNYIFRPDKVIHHFCGGVGVTPYCPAEDMMAVSSLFNKANGVQLRHFIVSFAPDELKAPKTAYEIATQLAQYIGREYQVIYAVHEDEPQLHFHLVHNSVSYVDGHRYYGTRREFFQMKAELSRILRPYGLFVFYAKKAKAAPEGTSDVLSS